MRNENKIFYLQIDGLSYTALKKALNSKFLPHLKKYIELKNSKIMKQNSVIPSSTLIFQAKLFYGLTENILGYRWYIKKKNKLISANLGNLIFYIEQQMQNRRHSKFMRGVVMDSILSGGSKNPSSLSISGNTRRAKDVKRSLKKFLEYSFINRPALALNLLRHIFIEIKEDFWGWLSIEPPKRIKTSFISFLYRCFNGSLLSQYSISKIFDEIKKETFPIYWDFGGYDMVAHRFGDESKLAFNELDLIDNYITKLIIFANMHGYKVKLFSDHGQTKSLIFHRMNNKKLEQILSEYLKIERSMIREIPDENYSESIKNEKIIILNGGPTSLIYFRDFKHRLTENEINRIYPGLLKKLIDLKGIGLIIVKKDRRNVSYLSKYKNPLNRYKLNSYNIKKIDKWVKMRNQGDIILLGDFDGEKVVSFEEQISTHAGITGAEMNRFEITFEPS